MLNVEYDNYWVRAYKKIKKTLLLLYCQNEGHIINDGFMQVLVASIHCPSARWLAGVVTLPMRKCAVSSESENLK